MFAVVGASSSLDTAKEFVGEEKLMRSLMPWKWGSHRLPVIRDEQVPDIYRLQREMNRLVSEFFRGTDLEYPAFFDEQIGGFWPKLDMKETEKEIVVSVEVPGMTEQDVEVHVTDDALIVRGEKKEEKEEAVKGYYRMERSYGTFERQIPLPSSINKDLVEALFKDGVITIKLPRRQPIKADTKQISIKTSP